MFCPKCTTPQMEYSTISSRSQPGKEYCPNCQRYFDVKRVPVTRAEFNTEDTFRLRALGVLFCDPPSCQHTVMLDGECQLCGQMIEATP